MVDSREWEIPLKKVKFGLILYSIIARLSHAVVICYLNFFFHWVAKRDDSLIEFALKIILLVVLCVLMQKRFRKWMNERGKIAGEEMCDKNQHGKVSWRVKIHGEIEVQTGKCN